MTDEERFWSKVEKGSSCWRWTSTKGHFGYGVIKIGGRNVYAHRMSFVLHHGEIPEGMCVLHKCDNPECVKPDHLFLGTKAQNMADKVGKQRQARGWQIRKKLTQSQIKKIRTLYTQGGNSYQKLANEFGVSKSAIAHVVKERSWKPNG